MVGGCGSAVTVVSCASWRFTSVRFAGSESEKCEEDLLWKRTEVMGRRCLELFGAILSLKRMGQSEVQCGKFKLVAHEVRERRCDDGAICDGSKRPQGFCRCELSASHGFVI